MTSVRRWYIFLVCAVSLQSATWAGINLLRNLLTRHYNATAVALPIAVIVIGLPVFLVHWLWAQSLARHDPEEHTSPLRSLYLYGMLSGFLAPFLINTFNLVNVLFLMLLGVGGPTFAYGALFRARDNLAFTGGAGCPGCPLGLSPVPGLGGLPERTRSRATGRRSTGFIFSASAGWA